MIERCFGRARVEGFGCGLETLVDWVRLGRVIVWARRILERVARSLFRAFILSLILCDC